MRTVDTMLEFEEIPVLFQYLYMNEDHNIIVNNGITDLQIRMTDRCYFAVKNLSFPDVPEHDYTDMMNIPNMLGIINQLKTIPPADFKNEFSSRWEEIKAITAANVTSNRMRFRH